MELHPVEGDIVDVAPKCAQAAALWLRKGINRRWGTWDRLREKYGNRLVFEVRPEDINPRSSRAPREVILDRPWGGTIDRLIDIQPPDGNLKYLYVFANSGEQSEMPDLSNRIATCLSELAKLEVRSVAMLQVAREIQDSPPAMIQALRDWDDGQPGQLDYIYLVDFNNALLDDLA